MEAISILQPSSVLDVGCGNGKYGYMCREMLEISKGLNVRIDAIEVFPEYIKDIHHNIYDNIYIQEAINALGEMSDQSYDLILAIDVLEHFSKEDGHRFLDELLRVGQNIIVSTPKLTFTQDALFGNPYEIHKTEWSAHELKIAPNIMLKDKISTIIVLGPGSDTIRSVKRNQIRISIAQFFMKIKRLVFPFSSNNLKKHE